MGDKSGFLRNEFWGDQKRNFGEPTKFSCPKIWENPEEPYGDLPSTKMAAAKLARSARTEDGGAHDKDGGAHNKDGRHILFNPRFARHQDGASAFNLFRRRCALIGRALPALRSDWLPARKWAWPTRMAAMAGGVSGVSEGNGEKPPKLGGPGEDFGDPRVIFGAAPASFPLFPQRTDPFPGPAPVPRPKVKRFLRGSEEKAVKGGKREALRGFWGL